MSEMHELIIDSTTKILKDTCTKTEIDLMEEGVWPTDLWNVLADSGLTRIAVPDSLGGTGGDFFDAFHILRLTGKFALPLPLAETLITNWLLAEHGQRPLNEPLTFSMEQNESFKIMSVGDGYEINGSIENVPWARFAQKMLVISSINGQDRLLLLPLKDATFKFYSNLAGEPFDTVTFTQVKVDKKETCPTNRAECIHHVNQLGALARSAMMSGALEKILDLTLLYAKTRNQFGRPLFKLQAIQQYLSVIYGEVVAGITVCDKAIATFELGETKEKVAHAKLAINESAGIVTDLAHQIHGAIGVTHEHQLHQFTRRLWAWREEFGNENYWASYLANKVLNSNSPSLWDYMSS